MILEQFFTEIISPPTGFVELRLISPDRGLPMERAWIAAGFPGAVASAAQSYAALYDVYYGVLPRTVNGGGTAEDTYGVARTLWADLDAKAWADDKDLTSAAGKRRAWETLLDYPVPANIIVDSGHGFHAYWLLQEAVPFGRAQAAMRQIQHDLNGDSVSDAARILRVPGTLNHKDSPPSPVRLLRYDLKRYPFDLAFEEWHERGTTEPRLAPARPGVFVDITSLPLDYQELIVHGAPQGGRSEACFKVAARLVRDGYDDEAILATFLEYPGGIGMKAAERRDGERWLERTIRKARAAVEAEL